jgi:flagellar hook-associated protein 2
MATTAVTSTTSTTAAAATPYSAKTAANKLITSLGSGSGVDTNALAQSLADAEIAPQKSIVNDKITKAQSRISGYAAIKYVLGNLQTAFKDLKDKSSFNSLTASNSQPNAVSMASTANASVGNHTIVVTQLATADKKLSNGLTSGSVALNGGATMRLSLSVHGATTASNIDIAAGSDTPSGIVKAINSANLGVTAQLVNTGEAPTPYKIMVTGTTGVSNDFSLTSNSSTPVTFGTSLQTAANGNVNVDGIPLTPSTNTLTDLIPGTTLTFTATTTGTGANIGLTRDTTTIKTKMQALVTTYNDANSMLNTLTNPNSTVDTYGATLVGNSLVSTVRNQMRAMFLPSSVMPNANGAPNSLRDLGVSIDKTGIMSLDSTKLDSVLNTRFDDVAKLMTNNLEGVSTFYTAAAGIAGDAVRNLSNMVSATSSLGTQTANQTSSIANYQKDLTRLNDRMTKILARYTQQLSTMDSIVGQTKAMQTSLTNTFAGMSAMYTNK